MIGKGLTNNKIVANKAEGFSL